MKEEYQHAGAASNKTRIEQAESRAQLAETRTEHAKSRTESAEMRIERAETRTELAKTRTEQAEIRTEQAETQTEQVKTALQRMVHNEIDLRQKLSSPLLTELPLNAIADQKSPLKQLTIRQREILQLIAEGQNTKEIAAILKISPKTVEYHRLRFMDCLKIHDIPSLVRFALRVGLIPPESRVGASVQPLPTTCASRASTTRHD